MKEYKARLYLDEGLVRKLASIFSSKIAQKILILLHKEALKGKDVHGKVKGLYFNEICRRVSASRTTVHKVLGELVVRYKVVHNEYEHAETSGGKRVVIVYRIRPEIIPIIDVIGPFLPVE